jgi:hypothetical protein
MEYSLIEPRNIIDNKCFIIFNLELLQQFGLREQNISRSKSNKTDHDFHSK